MSSADHQFINPWLVVITCVGGDALLSLALSHSNRSTFARPGSTRLNQPTTFALFRSTFDIAFSPPSPIPRPAPSFICHPLDSSLIILQPLPTPSSPTMAFLQSIILGSTSFLLGLIFVCQIIDIPLLYHPILTSESLESAYAFYTLWYDAPRAVKALLHTALGIPLLAIVSKLHGWSESAVFFDGSCLVLQMAIIIVYMTIHVPNLPVFGESLAGLVSLFSLGALPHPYPYLPGSNARGLRSTSRARYLVSSHSFMPAYRSRSFLLRTSHPSPVPHRLISRQV